MDMPGYLDYGKMAMQDPMAYGQSMDQLGLAKLFQAEKQKQAEAQTLADMMKNDQSKQMNPLLIEQQKQSNTARGMENENTGMTLGIRKATYPQEMQDKIEKFALQADDNKLKSIEQKINLAYLSGDSDKIEQAKHAEQFLSAVRAEKRKQTDKMEEERYKQLQQTGRDTEKNNTAIQVAQIGAQSRLDSANARKGTGIANIEQQVQLGKMQPAQAAVAFHGAAMAADDEETKAKYEQMAAQYETLAKQLANARAGTSADLTKLGVETNPVPPALTPNAAKPNAPQHKLSDVMAMYPGKSEAEVRAAYKRKFGVDL